MTVSHQFSPHHRQSPYDAQWLPDGSRIIYFGAETKRGVIQTFHEKLHPGGYLLMGHSESLLNLSNDFELRHLSNDMVYRRPTPGEEITDRWHTAAEAAIGRLERDGGAS